MRKHDEKWYKCPYDQNHAIAETRMTFHMVKCEEAFKRANPGVQKLFRCKFNFMHFFYDEATLKAHETTAVCKKDDNMQTFEVYDKVHEEAQRALSRS